MDVGQRVRWVQCTVVVALRCPANASLLEGIVLCLRRCDEARVRTMRRGIRLVLLATVCSWFVLPLAWCQSSQQPITAVTESAGGQTSGVATTPSPSSSPDEKERLKVNPLTGQTSASSWDYIPLTG